MTESSPSPPPPSTILDLQDFLPSPNQQQFLEDHTSRVKGLIGGLGAGKTRTGAEAFVDLVLANPGCMTLMAGPTHEMTRDLCIPAFEAAMPPGYVIRYLKSEKTYICKGGRLVKHGSADNPTSLEGKNLAAFWADEARYWSLSSWKNLIARLREARAYRLQGLVTTTPGPGWLASEFDADHPGRTTYRVSTRENARNLAPGYIEDLCRSYSKKQIEALIEGHFTTFVGAVYEDFDERKHVVPWRHEHGLRTGLVVDFGVASPSVLVWQLLDSPRRLDDGRVLPAGSVVVFDELHPDNTPTVRLARMVAERLGWTKDEHEVWRPGMRLDVIYCDPAGNARDQASGIPSVEVLRQVFTDVDVRWLSDPTARWIPNGVALLQGRLAPADGGAPRFYVAEAIREGGKRGLVKSLRSYAYREVKGRVVSDIPAKDGVFDHAADCARYLAMNLDRDESAGKRPRVIRSIPGGY